MLPPRERYRSKPVSERKQTAAIYPLLAIVMDSADRPSKLVDKLEMLRRGTSMLLAIELYSSVHHRLPDSLGDLAAEFSMGIEIISNVVSRNSLRTIAAGQFGDFVKAVVDVERGIMAIGGDLQADEQALLLDAGSELQYLWGINLYPDLPKDQWVEFDSMINVRPTAGNRSRSVESPSVREKILSIAARLVED